MSYLSHLSDGLIWLFLCLSLRPTREVPERHSNKSLLQTIRTGEKNFCSSVHQVTPGARSTDFFSFLKCAGPAITWGESFSVLSTWRATDEGRLTSSSSFLNVYFLYYYTIQHYHIFNMLCLWGPTRFGWLASFRTTTAAAASAARWRCVSCSRNCSYFSSMSR